MKKLLVLLALTGAIIFAMCITGCGGNDAPAGPVIMAVIPSYEGVALNHYANRFFGPAGKYSFALVSGIGEVVSDTGIGKVIDPYQDVNEYTFGVAQLTSFDDAYPGSFIRTIIPDSAGLYDLAPWSYYLVTAYETDGFGASEVAECRLSTEAVPTPPVQ